MSSRKEVEIHQKIIDAESELAECIQQAVNFESKANSELNQLESELPDIVLSCILGMGDEDKKKEIRNRIIEVKEDLNTLPAVDKIFQQKRAKISALQNQERLYRQKRQSYEKIKQKVMDDQNGLIGLADVDNLRGWAKSLECQSDCELFIKEMQGVTA